jgi:hypothetical protein
MSDSANATASRFLDCLLRPDQLAAQFNEKPATAERIRLRASYGEYFRSVTGDRERAGSRLVTRAARRRGEDAEVKDGSGRRTRLPKAEPTSSSNDG